MENDAVNAKTADSGALGGENSAQNGGNGEYDAVLDVAKVDSAITEVFEVFKGLDLTVAEAIQVILSIKAAFEAMYPDVFGVLRELKGAEADLRQ